MLPQRIRVFSAFSILMAGKWGVGDMKKGLQLDLKPPNGTFTIYLDSFWTEDGSLWREVSLVSLVFSQEGQRSTSRCTCLSASFIASDFVITPPLVH